MSNQKNTDHFSVWSTSLAVFAMFFGAGNLIFPLLLGQYAGDKNIYATIGFLGTAVLMPVIGLMAMAFFNGNYKEFFYRVGKPLGIFLLLLCMFLLGPLAIIPRTITLTHSIFDYTFIESPLWLFSLISCLIILPFAWYRGRLIDVFAYALTPLLILFLAFIIIKGISLPATPSIPNGKTIGTVFLHGLEQGYNTLDLLAALFFSTLIITGISSHAINTNQNNSRYLFLTTLKVSLIGGGLLALTYIGMSHVTALHGQHPTLLEATPDQLIAALSWILLGEQASVIAAIITALACLTTAISLTIIFAEFLQNYLFAGKITYTYSLFITLIMAFFVSLLGFSGIMKLLLPLLKIFYPVFITLSVVNIAYKMWGFKMVKTPVYLTLLISLGIYFRY